jgi:hypothetical protein
MNAILTLLNLILEIARRIFRKYETEKAQDEYDAIDNDPASQFMSRFNNDNKETNSSVPESTKRNCE